MGNCQNKNMELENLIPVHKMGFKILREVQLKNMFPTYENLFEKIDTHRTWVRKLKEIDRRRIDYQYNLMYDTVFSIFGSRGSGKTSAVFTLKNMIEKRYKSQGDIVLPIIMPEMIPDNCDIISWILAIIEQIVTQIEEKLQRNATERRKIEDDGEFFYNCRFKKDNKLRQEYEQVKEFYFSKGYSLRQSESFYAAIGDSEMQIQNGYKFSRAFTNFWTTLKAAIEKIQGNGDEIEPLIYLIFDDVDLAPNKVVEMLAAIVKYLSHPNLIVIVTADEELFNEVVENSLRKKLGYDEEQNRGIFTFPKYFYSDYDEFILNEALERKRHLTKTARLYLDKILPPSSRYYINTFDTCLKRRGFIERIDRQGNKDTVIDIETLLQTEINGFIKERNGEAPKTYDNFLYYKANAGQFINAYLLLWGSTSRQLANQCFLVEELISSFKKIYRFYKKNVETEHTMSADLQQQIQREIYQQVYHYLYNTINSNGNIDLDAEEINNIVNHMWYLEHDQWPLYVNYHYLNEFYDQKIREMDISDQWSRLVKFIFGLYTLLFFFLYEVYIWDNKKDDFTINSGRKRIHGKKDLVNFFDGLTKEGVSLVRNSDNEGVERLLYLYGWMMEIPEVIRDFDIVNYSAVKNYFYMLQAEERDCTQDSLKRWSRNNPIWFSNMVQAAHLAYRGIYLLGKNDVNRIALDDRLNAYDLFVQNEKQKFRRIIIKYFTNIQDTPITNIKDELDMFELAAKNLNDNKLMLIKEISDTKNALADIAEKMENELKGTLTFQTLNPDISYMETDKYFMVYLMINYPEIVPEKNIWNKKDDYAILDATIEKIKMELHIIHKEFNYYFVKNCKNFTEALGKIKLYIDPYYMDIITTWERSANNKNAPMKISKEELDNVLSLSAVKKMSRRDEEQLENLGISASEARLQIMGSLELLVNDKKLAMKYITLWKSLQFFLPYYVKALIRHREEASLSESFQDLKYIAGTEKKKTFSYAFYEAVSDLLKQNENTELENDGINLDYVKALLHSRIEMAGHRYYQYIMEEEDE